jgi:hypothetical protein
MPQCCFDVVVGRAISVVEGICSAVAEARLHSIEVGVAVETGVSEEGAVSIKKSRYKRVC